MAFSLPKYQQLVQQIEAICLKKQRNPAEIKILAATKYASLDDTQQAIQAGITLIGENKIQDAQMKFAALSPVERHFIGHLQTNKVKLAVKLFDMIESVDSLKLAEAIDNEAKVVSKIMPVLLEVNIASDPKKFGFQEDEVALALNKIESMKALKVYGLMAIIPFFEDVEQARTFFKRMKVLFDKTKKTYPYLITLSMGMSHDYAVAVEEGSTEIRIGSLLFT